MSFHQHGDPWGHRPPPPPPGENDSDDSVFGRAPPPRLSSGLSSPWGFCGPAAPPPNGGLQPPLPPPPPHDTAPPFFHMQGFNQSNVMHRPPPPPPQHLHQLQHPHAPPPQSPAPPQAPYFAQFAAPPPPPPHRDIGILNGGFDLSQSMGGLAISGGEGGGAELHRRPSFTRSGSFGTIGSNAPTTLSSSTVPSHAPPAPADPWAGVSFDSDRMRNQMNLQMAALYRSGGGEGLSPPSAHQRPQHMPLAQSGEALLGLLNGGGPGGAGGGGLPGSGFDMDRTRPRPPPVALASSFPPAPRHLPPPPGGMAMAMDGHAIPPQQQLQQQQQRMPRGDDMFTGQLPKHDEYYNSNITTHGNNGILTNNGHTNPRRNLSSSWDERDRYMSVPRPIMARAMSQNVMPRSPPHQRDCYGGNGGSGGGMHHGSHGDGMARSLPPARSPFNGSSGGGSGGPSSGGYDPLARRDSGSNLNFGGSGSGAGGGPGGGGGGGSTAVVSPDVTKPNDTIKVQVCLATDECRLGRVLLIGLFRIGQPTNEKPIFVKQVLYENKIHRQARHWNTRITFRAPRSPGEFEFRIFEELKPRQRTDHPMDNNGEYGHGNGDGPSSSSSASASASASASGFYSNATIVRSNRLKVAMDYSHFIEFLRSITEKFRQNRVKRDTGGILSNLLAFMRLIDQIETVFLHGQALLEDFVSDLLSLVSLDEQEMARFPVTDTIPSPIETFHGTVRNVLNSVQANPWIHEFVSFECWQQVEFYQQRLYCAVSGLYFRCDADKAAYWARHYQFEPLTSGTVVDTKSHQWHAFVKRHVSHWIDREAATLIPDADAFRRQRQGIYNVLHTHVVRKIDGVDANLDVFGSSANDFGTSESDMDMCLVLPPEIVATMSVDDKRRVLSQVVHRLESRPDLFCDVDATRLTARIPIVMFKMSDSGIECDLCVENVLAQRNTSLLRAYANADPRVRVLAFVLKQFVKKRRMNCAAESTLSSYGYLLMLIHFLQRQDPPVLPVLQTLPPMWDGEPLCACDLFSSTGSSSSAVCPRGSPFCRLTERTEALVKERQLPSVMARAPGASPGENNNSLTDAGLGLGLPLGAPPPSLASTSGAAPPSGSVETYFFDPYAFPDPTEKLALLQKYGSRNASSVGELFVGFLEYYGLLFDASRSVVSVRLARELLKSEKKTHHQWKLHSRLSIEDPFEISYDVAHVLKGTRDKYIRQQFVRAFTLLVQAAGTPSEEDDDDDDNASDNGSDSDAAMRVDRAMRLVMEPVTELPFHMHKDQPTAAMMAVTAAMVTTAAGNAAAAATAASVLGGVFNDAFDASFLAD